MFPPLTTRIIRRIARHLNTKPFFMRNRAPLVSFTFDDIPESAYTNGAAVLEDFGIRGTFYIAAGTCGTMDTYWRVVERDQVRALHMRGHEIGCHTFSHRPVDSLDAQTTDEECRRNLYTLRDWCPDIELTNFCYPLGCVSLPRKLQLQNRFDTCRSIYEGVNAGLIDLGLLKVIELYERTLSQDKLHHVLRYARDHNGWVIFYVHDVAPQPTHMGCSPMLLSATIKAVQAQKLECLPIRLALPTIGYFSNKQPAEFRTSSSIALS